MNWEAIKETAQVLIIDDDSANVRLLVRMLEQAGYRNIASTTDPRQAIDLHRDVNPDIILLDLQMPGIDGFELLPQLQEEIGPDAYLPVLVITADVSPEVKLRALLLGAKDFQTKPIDRIETMLRIRILLETRFLFLNVQRAERTTQLSSRGEIGA